MTLRLGVRRSRFYRVFQSRRWPSRRQERIEEERRMHSILEQVRAGHGFGKSFRWVCGFSAMLVGGWAYAAAAETADPGQLIAKAAKAEIAGEIAKSTDLRRDAIRTDRNN